MNKTTFGGHEIIFGTYFLGQWIEKTQANDVQDALSGFQKNPFKNIPLFISIAIESTAEMKGEVVVMNLMEVSNIIDNAGGIQGKEVQDLLGVFTNSLSVKNENTNDNVKNIAPKKK